MALHGVPGPDHQLGLHALDVRARILDDAIVAILDRPRPLDRDDRVRVNPGGHRNVLESAKSALTPRRPLTTAAWRSASAASGSSSNRSARFCSWNTFCVGMLGVPTESTLPVSVRCTTSASTLTAPTGVAHAAARIAAPPTRNRRAPRRPCAIGVVVIEARL